MKTGKVRLCQQCAVTFEAATAHRAALERRFDAEVDEDGTRE